MRERLCRDFQKNHCRALREGALRLRQKGFAALRMLVI